MKPTHLKKPIYFYDDRSFNGAIFTTRKGDDIAITRKSTPDEILAWVTIVVLDTDFRSGPYGLYKKIISTIRTLQCHHLNVNKTIKILLSGTKEDIEDLMKKRREYDAESIPHAYYDVTIEEKVNLKKSLEKLLVKKKKIEGYITDDDIIRAKEYPMENLLEFSRANKTECIFHDQDKTPSLTLYKKTNTVYCFGCNKKADTIAVYQQQTGSDFITAVKHLSK